MTAPKSQFDFELTTPIKYQKDGEFHEARVIAVKAPSKKHRKQSIRIKQGFYQAMQYHQANNASSEKAVEEARKKLEEGDETITGQEIMMMLYMSDVDIERFDEAFDKLLLSPGICMVDDAVQLTTPILDELSEEDTDRLLGEYMENFFVGSMMNG